MFVFSPTRISRFSTSLRTASSNSSYRGAREIIYKLPSHSARSIIWSLFIITENDIRRLSDLEDHHGMIFVTATIQSLPKNMLARPMLDCTFQSSTQFIFANFPRHSQCLSSKSLPFLAKVMDRLTSLRLTISHIVTVSRFRA